MVQNNLSLSELAALLTSEASFFITKFCNKNIKYAKYIYDYFLNVCMNV